MAGVSRAAASYLIVAVLCGCWRGSAEPAAVEPSPRARRKGATCTEVGANVERMLARGGDADLAARATPMRGAVERRCAEDGWSVELRRCIAGARTAEDANGCETLATDAQREAFEHELEVMVVTDDAP